MTDLAEFTQKFTDVEIPAVLNGTTYFAPTHDLLDAPLIYTSTRLGETRRKKFTPSIALLDILGKHSKRIAIINERSSWLFLCGRNVLKEGIVSNPESEGLVLVANENKEILGYGKITGAGITNLLDRGDFLRRER